MSTGKVRTVSDDARTRLGISDDAVLLDDVTDQLSLRVLRTSLRVAAAAVVVAAALYVALAVTVVAVMDSGEQSALVVRGAFPGGVAKPGEFAFTSAQAYDRSLPGKITQAFVGVPGGATMEIVAVPGSKLTMDADGQVLANQLPTRFFNTPGASLPAAQLGHEYLAVCISGNGCVSGELVVVPDNHVVGKVTKFAGFTGFRDPKSTRS